MKKMGNNWFTFMAIAFCMILGFGADVYAQGGGACAGDIAKFCKDLQPGGGRIANCLKEHQTELSPECQEKWLKQRKKQ